MNIVEFQNKLKRSTANFDRLKEKAVNLAGDDIANTITEQQLQGIDKNGQKIKPKYSNKYYANRKNKQNGAAGLFNPDLHLSGDMHKGLSIYTEGKKVDYKSNVPYFKYLKPKYDDAFGVTPKNLPEIWRITTPILQTLFFKTLI